MIPSDQIRFEEPQAGLQRLTARFGGHAYDLHRHETYAVGLTLWGAQSFHYRGSLRTSRGGQVMVIHPDEAHDGHAGVDQGFAYRMLYVDPASVSAALDGANPPFVPDVVADDPALADLLREAFADFPQALEPLALDAIVGRLAELLAARGDGAETEAGQDGPPGGRRGRASSWRQRRIAPCRRKSSRRSAASTALPSPATSAPPSAPRRTASRSAVGWPGRRP